MASYQRSSADSVATAGEIRDTGSASSDLKETFVDKKFCLIPRSNSIVRYDQLHGFLQLLLQSARTKRPDAEAVEPMANALIDFYSQVLSQDVENYTVRQSPKSIFHCVSCGCLFVEPVTLACGHTLCKPCVESGSDYMRSIHCQQCGLVHQKDSPSVNVLITNLLQKCFPNEYEVEVRKLKELLPEMYSDRSDSSWKILDSLSNFLKNVPNHVVALKWRSDAFAQRGQYGEALEDIEKACQIRPFLSSVFHRKGLLLKTLNELREAVLCFSRCAALEPGNVAYRSELVFSLTKLLSLQNPTTEGGHKPVALTKEGTCKAQSFYDQVSCNAQPSPVKNAKRAAAFDLRKRLVGTDEKNSLDSESASVVDSAGLGKRSGLKRPVSNDSSLSPHNNQAHSSRIKRQSLPTEKRIKLHHDQTTIRDLKHDFASNGEDLDCKVCYNLLFQPVTTFCGHTFCRECLLRCLDHRSVCPCCRHELNCSVEINRKVTTEVEEIAKQLFYSEYAQREKSFAEEKERWIRVGLDEDVEVPIFVCMLVFPCLSYPLHIFEPRYRLMTRQCIELGTRMFGICPPDDDADKGFADYGTMVHIEKLNVLPDGRSIIQTKAGRRFRVISRGMKNGYNTAKIEWLRDDLPTDQDQIKELKVINADCRKLLELWYNSLSELQRTCITNAIGPLPKLDGSVLLRPNGPAWVWWALAAVPLLDKAKLAILTMTSLNERLLSIRCFLEVMLNVMYGNN